MVNNSININKTHNHLQLQLIDHEKATTYDVRNPAPCLRQVHTCGVVPPLNETHQPRLDNWISNSNTSINKLFKNCVITSFWYWPTFDLIYIHFNIGRPWQGRRIKERYWLTLFILNKIFSQLGFKSIIQTKRFFQCKRCHKMLS